MPSIVKLLLGGLLAALAPWFLHNVVGLGKNCDAAAPAATPDLAAPAAAVAEAPATAEAVKDCQADVDTVVKGKTINFESARAIIKADSIPLIDALASASKDCAGTQIVVAGHTDQEGDGQYNLRLSEERANAVVAALTERGVPRERLLPKGFGETQLLDQGNSAEALAKNRRIEFNVAAAGTDAAAAPAADANASAPAAN